MTDHRVQLWHLLQDIEIGAVQLFCFDKISRVSYGKIQEASAYPLNKMEVDYNAANRFVSIKDRENRQFVLFISCNVFVWPWAFTIVCQYIIISDQKQPLWTLRLKSHEISLLLVCDIALYLCLNNSKINNRNRVNVASGD